MTTAIEREAIESADPARHAEEHPPGLAHHFGSLSQQYEAAKLGMWLFLATEVLLFGGLFCLYAVYRFNHPEVFTWGSQFLNVRLGTINTLVLIFSSVTMAVAVNYSQLNRPRVVITALAITFVCGVAFMGIKSVEYKDKFDHHHVWGVGFYEGSHDDDSHADEHAVPVAAEGIDGATGHEAVASDLPAADEFSITKSAIPLAASGPSGLDPAFLDGAGDDSEATAVIGERPTNAHIFFGIYFLMTGLHAIHVLGGLGMIAWLLLRTVRGHFGSTYFTPVDLGGLYWHIVDLIWIFLFPLFYLIA